MKYMLGLEFFSAAIGSFNPTNQTVYIELLGCISKKNSKLDNVKLRPRQPILVVTLYITLLAQWHGYVDNK